MLISPRKLLLPTEVKIYDLQNAEEIAYICVGKIEISVSVCLDGFAQQSHVVPHKRVALCVKEPKGQKLIPLKKKKKKQTDKMRQGMNERMDKSSL